MGVHCKGEITIIQVKTAWAWGTPIKTALTVMIISDPGFDSDHWNLLPYILVSEGIRRPVFLQRRTMYLEFQYWRHQLPESTYNDPTEGKM